MNINIPDNRIADLASAIKTFAEVKGNDNQVVRRYIRRHLVDFLRQKARKDALDAVVEPELTLS